MELQLRRSPFAWCLASCPVTAPGRRSRFRLPGRHLRRCCTRTGPPAVGARRSRPVGACARPPQPLQNQGLDPAGEEPRGIRELQPEGGDLVWVGDWALPLDQQGLVALGTPLATDALVQRLHQTCCPRPAAGAHPARCCCATALRRVQITCCAAPALSEEYAAGHDAAVARCMARLLSYADAPLPEDATTRSRLTAPQVARRILQALRAAEAEQTPALRTAQQAAVYLCAQGFEVPLKNRRRSAGRTFLTCRPRPERCCCRRPANTPRVPSTCCLRTTRSSSPIRFSVCPCCVGCALPLPLAPRHCHYRGQLDPLGDHRAACATAGVLPAQVIPLERALGAWSPRTSVRPT